VSESEVYAAIRAALIEHAEPHKLPLMQRFFREPIDAYCTYTAHVRRIARQHAPWFQSATAGEREALTAGLWASGKFEEGAVAIHLYARIVRQCGVREWRLFESWLRRHVRNWAHCDTLCADVLGPLLIRHPDWIRRLAAWHRSKQTYKRRAALVAPLKGLRKGLFRDELSGWVSRLEKDPQDIVRKARKWAVVELAGRSSAS
jgi:3-methyladenine DNA glycosylase AlkD